MTDTQKDLEFLQKVAEKISLKSEQGAPITKEEVFDLFKDTLEEMAYARIIDVPIFMPFVIVREDDFYTAKCSVYRKCKGIGDSEEEAVQRLKKEIERYNSSLIETEKEMKIDEILKNMFPRDAL